MNNQSNTIENSVVYDYPDINIDELEEQVTALKEWKVRAKMHLEHFRLACRLYNLCDTEELTKLIAN